MKLKLSQITNSIPSLKVLQETKFPSKVSYRIMRLADKLDNILSTFNKKRTELVKQYGVEAEDGTFSVTDPEKIKLFSKEIQEILETEEEVEFKPIKINDIGDITIQPKDLVSFVFTD